MPRHGMKTCGRSSIMRCDLAAGSWLSWLDWACFCGGWDAVCSVIDAAREFSRRPLSVVALLGASFGKTCLLCQRLMESPVSTRGDLGGRTRAKRSTSNHENGCQADREKRKGAGFGTRGK